MSLFQVSAKANPELQIQPEPSTSQQAQAQAETQDDATLRPTITTAIQSRMTSLIGSVAPRFAEPDHIWQNFDRSTYLETSQSLAVWEEKKTVRFYILSLAFRSFQNAVFTSAFFFKLSLLSCS